MAEGVQASVPESVCETAEAVSRIARTASAATVQEVARSLGIDKSAASRRCKTAEGRGYIRNQETSRGRPARYVPADPLPVAKSLLPHPDVLASAMRGGAGAEESGCTIAVETEGYAPLPPPPGEKQSASPERRRVVL
jgi:hypothetical protein